MIVSYVNGDNLTYFDSIGAEHIPKEMTIFISNKDIKTKTCRIQAVIQWFAHTFVLDLLMYSKVYKVNVG